MVSLQGMPGLGKTAVAVTLVYDPSIQSAFTDGVQWQTLGKQADPLSLLLRRCRDLGVPQLLDGCVSAAEAGGRFRAYLLRNKKRVLFVLDDGWRTEHIQPLIVGGGGCATIITTRLLTIVEEFVPAGNRYQPSRLSETEALDLLKDRAGDKVVNEHLDACRELVRRLDGLPLVLVVAARLLNRAAARGRSVENLIQDLAQRTDRLLREPVPPDVAQFLVDVENPNVVALLQLSTDELDDETFRCFVLLGNATSSEDATFSLKRMARGWKSVLGQQSHERAQAIADALIGAGLMQPAGTLFGEVRYYMHDLLIQHAKTAAKATGGE